MNIIDINQLPVRMTIEFAAKVSGMSKWTIKKYAQLRKFPCVYKGRRLYIKTRQFLEWLEKDEPVLGGGNINTKRDSAGRFAPANNE